jgi:hypothetical protein
MEAKRPSWNQKLDPGIFKLIRFYIDILHDAGLPGNSGWLTINDYYIDKLEKQGLEGWFHLFEELAEESNIKLAELIGKERKLSNAEIVSNKKKFKKWILHETENLPDDSKEYYMQAFLPYYSDKSVEVDKDKYPSMLKRFFADIQLLIMHKSYIEDYENIKAMGQDNAQIRKDRQRMINKPTAIHHALFAYYDAVARLVFQKSLTELIRLAKKGDVESLFELMRIDRTVIGCEWVLIGIRKAQLGGDSEFFMKMSKAISTPPLENVRQYGDLILALHIFWNVGLYRLTKSELIALLEGAGLKVQDDPETFRKFVDRLTISDSIK